MIFFENKRKEFGFKLNEMIEMMKETEIKIKGKELTEEEEKKYENQMIETEDWIEKKRRMKQRQNEIKKFHQEKSLQMMNGILNEKEIEMIENDIGRYFEWIIFDSKIHFAEKNHSNFHSFIENETNFIILIETNDGIKFGCFVDSYHSIIQPLTYSDGFVFRIRYNCVEKYFYLNEKNYLIIGDEDDKLLFSINNKNVQIMKHDELTKVSNEIINSDTMKSKGNPQLEYYFSQLKHIYVIGTSSKREKLTEQLT